MPSTRDDSYGPRPRLLASGGALLLGLLAPVSGGVDLTPPTGEETTPAERVIAEDAEEAIVETRANISMTFDGLTMTGPQGIETETTILFDTRGPDGGFDPERISQILAERVQLRGLTVRRSDGETHQITTESPLLERASPFALASTAPVPTPTVMIGVRMETPNEALAGHLGIDAERSTMLSAVYEGLAASKSGLRAYDVIIDIDGAGRADVDTLREGLLAKSAGESIALDVMQRGELNRVVVALEAYDAERLPTRGLYATTGLNPDRGPAGLVFGNGGQASGAVQFWAPGVASAPGTLQTQRQLDRLDSRLARLELLLLQYVTDESGTPAPERVDPAGTGGSPEAPGR